MKCPSKSQLCEMPPKSQFCASISTWILVYVQIYGKAKASTVEPVFGNYPSGQSKVVRNDGVVKNRGCFTVYQVGT